MAKEITISEIKETEEKINAIPRIVAAQDLINELKNAKIVYTAALISVFLLPGLYSINLTKWIIFPLVAVFAIIFGFFLFKVNKRIIELHLKYGVK